MKIRIYILIAAMLTLSIPWFFFNWSESNIFGLPDWAAYSLIFVACFAVVMVIIIEKYWTDFSE